ncbi:hypothetical protein [Mesobacillus subterraneus]|uniref:hypothetical protein n=1 Tax=Mesobacillus subterraneus TaxID=285983 RepID=UPI001CFCE2D2|nr:hypothetical protein [Mesobacillus subterraneus]
MQDNWVKKYSYVLQAHCENTVPCIARYIFTIHEGILQCKGYTVYFFQIMSQAVIQTMSMPAILWYRGSNDKQLGMSILKKKLILSFSVLVLLAACNSEESYTHWTDSTDNQIQRLDDAGIKYEIREGEIWVRDKDLKKAVACCS